MKRLHFARAVCLLVTGFILLTALTACSRGSLTTDTRSAELSSDKEKVESLARYLKLESNVDLAEFHIQYKDNSGGWVPGPSDYDIQAVMKVNPEDADRWAEGMQSVSPDANATEQGDAFSGWPEWGHALLPQNATWQVRSQPALFAKDGGWVMVAIFKPEGIVMKRVIKY